MTDLIETIRRTLVPIHKEGYPFILIGIVLTVVLGYFSQFFGWIFLILTLWVCYFFRDPVHFVVMDQYLRERGPGEPYLRFWSAASSR